MCFACDQQGWGHAFRGASNRRQFLQGSTAASVLAAATVTRVMPALADDAKAETLIENAKIVTLDAKRPVAEAIAIAGDRIIGVGTRREMERFRTADTKVIDAGKRTIIPGLGDGHTHFIRGGLSYSQELRWDGVPSLVIALRMLREQAQRTPAPHWVQVVGGWTTTQFAEKRLPTVDEVNAATGEVPAFVMHIYDRAIVNKAGLRVLGIGKDSPEPFGGKLERDAAGVPTGVVINVTSIGSLLGIFARIPKLAADQQIVSTRHFMRELNRLGVTSVIDAGGGGQNYPDNYKAIQQLAADKALTLRIGYTLFAQRPGKELEDYKSWVGQVKPGQGDEYFRMIGAGEYMVWAMHDPANFTKEVVPPTAVAETQLVEAIKLVASNGWPFRLHANYDQTAQNLLRAIETAHRDVPVDKLRWVIDHGETLTVPTLERIQKLGGGVGIQNRMTLDGDAFAARWGREAAADAPPIGRIRKMGLPLAAGTDGNRASSHNPWVGLEWLVTGRTISGAKLQGDDNLLSRAEALRLYTAAVAHMSGEEDRKGTLSVGKWADLAILDRDYFGVPAREISKIEAVLTMVGGRIVYGGDRYAELAPKALPVSPDWLPIGTYRSYQKADLSDGGVKLAAAYADTGLPDIVADDGRRWSMGCLCGLI